MTFPTSVAPPFAPISGLPSAGTTAELMNTSESFERSTNRKPVSPAVFVSGQSVVRAVKWFTNEAGFVANVETVDMSPKQVPRSNVWPVDRTRLPAGCIGWPVPVARNFELPSLKLSSMTYGSPSGVRVAENVAVPAGSPPLSTIGNEPLNVVPSHVTSAG